ncbi:protein RETICULATA-RELATED 3, chloroplastic-like [Magnolia sinica]|uniref:protein RETICULATA-RELATED 3, chloroplastic-like n=1 Tax=Magnolia sinica TaxID=86752 RepID=UPI00265ACCD5|nr:protein RETICULATA-RELATED 3, chloroplastic-like [Magnolia sinica]
MAQLRYSPFSTPPAISKNRHFSINTPRFPSVALSQSIAPSPSIALSLLPTKATTSANISLLTTDHNGNGPDGIDNSGRNGGNGGGGSNSNGRGDSSDEDRSQPSNFGPIGSFINGWRSRVLADPQFPFKVLMEEVVGVSSCVLGDMASRPNFGLNELDFVFSTLVVGSILNFVLMYLLAPTAGSSPSSMPWIFANSPKSHMFEVGPYSLFDRVGTFVYKGVLFAAVGFAAGLAGTALSNGLIKLRKKMDPEFETPNKPPPTILNAATWAIHMGLSSNLRYQTLNGLEFLLAKGLPELAFKTSVVVLRCLNNVLGGVSFVVLARLTGSQKVDDGTAAITPAVVGLEEEKEKLVGEGELESNQPHCK